MPVRSSLALLLRTLAAAQLTLAMAWWAWCWPASAGQAIVGSALVLFHGALVLAVEFLLLARLSRQDDVPVPCAIDLARAWWAEVGAFLRVFYGRQAFRWREVADDVAPTSDGRAGVIFIHGFFCNRGFWNPWLRQMRAQRRVCLAVNLEPVFASIDAYVPVIEAAVQRVTQATGVPPVLVCHSMGGLAARAWLRAQGDRVRVARVITIGSPHHGTWLARWSHAPNGRQMRQHSGWLAQLQQDEARRAMPPFTCWYSNCDNIVFPASTATLPGADNRLVLGAAHVELAFRPEVLSGTWKLFDSPHQDRKLNF